ncbi:MAG TPA: isoaspartyl peptidase/L-asparaginase family protein [Kofleriaceae bacterium]|nr:isoaspartyl peptidase/L-asparaginase family protein [Kofleriaceae bacterium]
MTPTPAIVVHGGAGDLDPGMGDAARAGCRLAVEAGLEVLATGGTAMDAVVAAVRVLEEDPTFNAGVGAALTREGTIECDAAIMDGTTRTIGAVAAMKDAGEAILVARAVLDDGEHVLLCGEGAWAFAREKGFVPRSDLMTEKSRRRWEAARQKRASASGGTVGACAIDASGHVAAATSTGGVTYKRVGRIGDTPLAGCGTYADDEGGAASATGIGEAIIRVTMTRVCVDAMRGGATASRAAWAAVDELARVTGGQAGIIACDARGRLGAALSTSTMSFGAGRVGGPVVVGIDLARGADLDDLLG